MPDALTAHGLRVHRFAEPTTVLGRFAAAFGREPPASPLPWAEPRRGSAITGRGMPARAPSRVDGGNDMAYYIARAADRKFFDVEGVPGLRQALLVGHEQGAAHLEVSLYELAPGATTGW